MIAHAADHLLHVCDRRFRLDAVAEIEDQSAGGIVFQHVVDSAIECRATGDQRQRIEITLQCNTILYALAD